MAAEFNDIFVVPLADGRLQYFAIDTNFQLWSQWKETTDPNSGWTSLALFQMPPINQVVKICGAQLPDGRVQLFAIDTDRATWSCWKTGDASSGWSEWTAF
jgi:hypothetical protein